MKKWLSISLLFLASLACAQNIVITGTVLSPSGQPYSNGNGKAQLQPSNVQWLFGNSPVPSPITIASLDSFGRFSVTLTSTAVIQPQSQGPTWQFSFCSQVYASQTQPVCFTMTPMALTTSQDISTQIQAQSVPLPSSGAGITSLGLSVPQGFNVSPSTLSAPGTFAITWNGTPIPNSAIPAPTASALGGVESITCTNQFLSAISTLGVPLCTTPSFVSLTTTGTAGAATLSGGVLNIPQYASSGGVVSSTAPFQALYSGTPGSTVTTVSGQQKPVYDVRDYGLACNGSTNDTAAMVALRTANTQNAAVAIPVDATHPGPCELGGINLPFTLDFSGGGAIGVIANPATPGNGALVQASPGTAYTGNSCTATLNSAPTAGNAVLMEIIYEFGSGTVPNLPTDSANDSFNVLLQSNLSFESNSTSWAAAAVAGGSASQAITVTLAGASTHGVCFAQEVSGEGTGIAVDPGSTFTYASGSSPYSGPYSVTAILEPGDFVLAYGGQGTNNTTCTQGSGFTQPSSTEGNVNGMCLQYQADSSAGSVTATQTTSPNSFSDYWVYNIVGIRPGTSFVHPQAGIIDPDLHQVFYNATAGEGIIDLTGSNVLDKVYPEWWGASYSASPTTNCAAIQAAEHGAFGFGRTSVSGLSIWNRPLYFTSQYAINCTIQFYSVTGFKIEGANKEYSGITQTAANTRIIDAQSMSRGSIHDMFFQTTASQNVPLVDLDYNGVTTAGDLETYDISTYDLNFVGNGLGWAGMENAKSGGGAQGDNIRLTNDNFYGFTQCGYMIGQGTNGVPFALADNALQNTIIGGDYQANNMYGICIYGGSAVINGTTFEDGFSSQAVGNSVGFDIYAFGNQFPISICNIRSESRKLWAGEGADICNSRTQEQSVVPNPPSSQPVGTIVRGNVVTGDGQYYQVTVDSGAYGGLGTPSSPIGVSSATSTSLTNTNETVAGSVTQLTVVAGHTVIQTGTSSTATLVNTPTSIGTITGSLTSGTFVVGHTMTQSSSAVTATVQNSPTGSVSLTGDNFSGTALGTSGLTWTDSNGAIYTQTAGPTFSVSNPSMLITNPSGSPNGSGTWVDQTTGGVYTPTGAPVPVANWTTNAFLGMLVGIQSGTSEGCYGVVTGNSAQTINFTAGYVTKFDKLLCPTSDTTSVFVVEPNWNGGTVVDGGITLVALNEDGIGVCVGCVGGVTSMDNVDVPGDKIAVSPNFSYLRNVTTTRPDWFDDRGNTAWDTQSSIARDWDVYLGDVTIVTQNGYFFQKYSQPGIGNGGGNVTASLQRNIGSELLVSTGGIGGSVPSMAPDSWIGGKSDPSCPNNDITCAPEEFGQSIGPPAAFGINQNGKPAIFVAGLSTGSGTPGNFDWYCGATGSSGTQVNSGGSSPSYCMTLGLNGLVLSSISASTSPICPNGTGGALTTSGCATGSFTAGGDLSGTSTSQEVVGVLSHALPSIATGFLNWTGTAWAFSSQYISSLTTTGTSGPATVSGGVLNIPQYAGGGGTGSQYQSAYFSNTNTVGAFGPGIVGQVATSQGASAAPVYTSQGLGLGNGGSPVTASTYLVKCDSGTTILDRGTVIVFQSGASAITLPDTGNTGCGAGFAFKIIDDAAGTITISRQTSSTINIANGTANSDGQTSFTMGNGAFATFSADGSGHYWVTLTQ